MALTHELVHLRRGDLLTLHLAELGFALQWFNPLVKTARQALRSDQEAACDEAVRGLGISTKSYAALLLKSAGLGRPVPALTLDHSLKERIVRMQLPVSAPLKRAVFILAASASAIAVAGFTASRVEVEVAQEQDQDRSERRANRSGSADEGRAQLRALLDDLQSLEADIDRLDDELEEAMEEGDVDEQRIEEYEAEVERMHRQREDLREEMRAARERAREGREEARRARDRGEEQRERARENAQERRIELRRLTEVTEDDGISVLHAPQAPRVHVIRDKSWADEDQKLILLNDPFVAIEKMKPADPPTMKAPKIKAPEVKTKETEEGTWMLIPSEPDMSEFEAQMDAFGDMMDAWGEKMGEWGEKMGNAGEAIGELAEDCEDHAEESDRPIILEREIEDSDDTVRAVCAAGGMERFRQADMQQWLRGEGVSAKELRTFRDRISG
jgi:hypothetical protein